MPNKKLVPFAGFVPLETPPEDDFESAAAFDGVRLGKEYLFFVRSFSAVYIPLNSVERCYKRIEDASASVCCGRAQFPACFFVVVANNGQLKKVRMRSEKTLDALLAELEKLGSVPVGYVSQEQRQEPS